jgi:hypothetical protein
MEHQWVRKHQYEGFLLGVCIVEGALGIYRGSSGGGGQPCAMQ